MAMRGGLAEMEKYADAVLEDPVRPHERDTSLLGVRRGLPMLSYGVVMGLVTTALGAFIASGLTGRVQIFVWVAVTGVLAVGAVAAADLAVGSALKLLMRQGRRGSGPRAS